MPASPRGIRSARRQFPPRLPLKMLSSELIETKLSQARRTEASFVAAVLAQEGGEHSRSGPIR